MFYSNQHSMSISHIALIVNMVHLEDTETGLSDNNKTGHFKIMKENFITKSVENTRGRTNNRMEKKIKMI